MIETANVKIFWNDVLDQSAVSEYTFYLEKMSHGLLINSPDAPDHRPRLQQ